MKVKTVMYTGVAQTEPIRKLSKKQRMIKKNLLKRVRKLHTYPEEVEICFYWNEFVGYYGYAFCSDGWQLR